MLWDKISFNQSSFISEHDILFGSREFPAHPLRTYPPLNNQSQKSLYPLSWPNISPIPLSKIESRSSHQPNTTNFENSIKPLFQQAHSNERCSNIIGKPSASPGIAIRSNYLKINALGLYLHLLCQEPFIHVDIRGREPAFRCETGYIIVGCDWHSAIHHGNRRNQEARERRLYLLMFCRLCRPQY